MLFSSSETHPRKRSELSTSVGRKCLAANVDLPLPLTPMRRTRAKSGMDRVRVEGCGIDMDGCVGGWVLSVGRSGVCDRMIPGNNGINYFMKPDKTEDRQLKREINRILSQFGGTPEFRAEAEEQIRSLGPEGIDVLLRVVAKARLRARIWPLTALLIIAQYGCIVTALLYVL